MATDDRTSAYVWAWLPDATEPMVAGRLDEATGSGLVTFTYGRSYLQRSDAMALFLPDLPLASGVHYPVSGQVPGPIADASPDAWGRRVIENRIAAKGRTSDLGPIDVRLESGSDRVGALDFQTSNEEYVARLGGTATLDELAEAAERIEAGQPLSPALDDALMHGSSIGGARPKAVLDDGDRELIAKFASSTDTYPVVQAEFLAMRLAADVGLDVAPVHITSVRGRHVLLVERFDRPGGGRRRAVVSALTILGLAELDYRVASYADLADRIRTRFADPTNALHLPPPRPAPSRRPRHLSTRRHPHHQPARRPPRRRPVPCRLRNPSWNASTNRPERCSEDRDQGRTVLGLSSDARTRTGAYGQPSEQIRRLRRVSG